MTHRTAATRYARALIEVALKEHVDLSQIETELAGFVALVSSHPDLERALLNPAVPAPRKRGAVAELTSQAKLVPGVCPSCWCSWRNEIAWCCCTIC